MNPSFRRLRKCPPRCASLACLGLTSLLACNPPEDDTGDVSDDGTPVTPWFQVGSGEASFAPLVPGGPLPIVWGSQGAAMFPMPVRGGGFPLPDDPADFGHPDIPILDLVLDIDGYSDDPSVHFKQISNYPVTFDILPDGSYEYIYLPVIVPDDVLDPQVFHGRAAHLHVELTPSANPTMIEAYDLIVDVAPPP